MLANLILSAVVLSPPAAATAPATPQSAAQQAAQTPAPEKICKYVVGSEPGAKPYQLCLTKAAWAAKEKMDAKDVTRTVCHYVDYTGGKFKSYKVCMTDAEWESQRQSDRQWIDHVQSQSGPPH